MTTDTATTSRDHGFRVLVRTALVTVSVGLVLTLVAALVAGPAAAWGALVGTLLVVGVFGFGSFTVNLVAAVMPAAALVVALLTYVLQVLVMGLVFYGLSGSGLLDDTIDRTWLGGSVIAGTVAWLVVQVVVATTRRIPVYVLPEPAAVAGAASGARRREGGEA
ncbi:hypothetical protein [Nocardioides pyridinolyticus]